MNGNELRELIHDDYRQALEDVKRERDELRNKVNKAMSIIKHGCDWQVPEDVLKNISDALK